MSTRKETNQKQQQPFSKAFFLFLFLLLYAPRFSLFLTKSDNKKKESKSSLHTLLPQVLLFLFSLAVSLSSFLNCLFSFLLPLFPPKKPTPLHCLRDTFINQFLENNHVVAWERGNQLEEQTQGAAQSSYLQLIMRCLGLDRSQPCQLVTRLADGAAGVSKS